MDHTRIVPRRSVTSLFSGFCLLRWEPAVFCCSFFAFLIFNILFPQLGWCPNQYHSCLTQSGQTMAVAGAPLRMRTRCRKAGKLERNAREQKEKNNTPREHKTQKEMQLHCGAARRCPAVRGGTRRPCWVWSVSDSGLREHASDNCKIEQPLLLTR